MHLTHDDLVLHYYGEVGADASRVEAHLAACDDCRAALARLQDTLALVDDSADGEPGPGYEATLWARLQPQLEAPAPWWHRAWQGGLTRWALVGAMTGVAALAFYAGSRVGHDSPVATTTAVTPDTPTSPPAGDRSRLLDLAVGDHLDRVQLMLAEVANGDATEAAPFEAERRRAGDLVATNRLFRQTASLTGDDSLDGVLDELERVLVDIANAPDDLTSDDWSALRARIDTQGLLFRVRVITEERRARQQPPSPALPKGPTS